MNSLDRHLGTYYRDAVVSPKEGALDRLVAALRDDPELAADARQRYASIDDRMTKKCFITKTQRAGLAQALAQLGD